MAALRLKRTFPPGQFKISPDWSLDSQARPIAVSSQFICAENLRAAQNFVLFLCDYFISLSLAGHCGRYRSRSQTALAPCPVCPRRLSKLRRGLLCSNKARAGHGPPARNLDHEREREREREKCDCVHSRIISGMLTFKRVTANETYERYLNAFRKLSEQPRWR
jgi:hypothetical protein